MMGQKLKVITNHITFLPKVDRIIQSNSNSDIVHHLPQFRISYTSSPLHKHTPCGVRLPQQRVVYYTSLVSDKQAAAILANISVAGADSAESRAHHETVFCFSRCATRLCPLLLSTEKQFDK